MTRGLKPKYVKHYVDSNGRRRYPEANRDNHLQRKYGITLEQYESMARAQNYVCLICKQGCKQNEYLSVDHCHETNRVRGLLCNMCNTGLGKFKDNPALMRNAADYVEKHYD